MSIISEKSEKFYPKKKGIVSKNKEYLLTKQKLKNKLNYLKKKYCKMQNNIILNFHYYREIEELEKKTLYEPEIYEKKIIEEYFFDKLIESLDTKSYIDDLPLIEELEIKNSNIDIIEPHFLDKLVEEFYYTITPLL